MTTTEKIKRPSMLVCFPRDLGSARAIGAEGLGVERSLWLSLGLRVVGVFRGFLPVLNALGLAFIALAHSIADTIALCAVAFSVCLAGATGILLAPMLASLIRNAWRSIL